MVYRYVQAVRSYFSATKMTMWLVLWVYLMSRYRQWRTNHVLVERN